MAESLGANRKSRAGGDILRLRLIYDHKKFTGIHFDMQIHKTHKQTNKQTKTREHFFLVLVSLTKFYIWRLVT